MRHKVNSVNRWEIHRVHPHAPALEARGIRKSYGTHEVLRGVDLRVEPGQILGLLGRNGAGKSTFLKLIMGEELPDGGKLRRGPTVKIGYLPQIIHFDHPERNLVDTMLYAQNCTTQTARNRLASFNFRGEDVFKPVSALSGGEQSRLRLCMLMDENINLLILDEPTNHLDIASREWIEEAVTDYEGTLLFVSHDRYFINQFANRIWMIEDGQVTDFRGTFEEFRAFQERRRQLELSAKAAPARGQQEESKPKSTKRSGGTKMLEKQVSAAERAVARAEEALEALNGQMEEAATDYVRLQELCAEKERMEEELSALYEQWEELSAALEEAQG